VNEERAAEGVDHLQRAAREVVAAAVSGVAGVLGDAVRRGLDGRGAPWEAAAWREPPFESDAAGGAAAPAGDRAATSGQDDDDDGADTEPWAASLVTEDRPDRPVTGGDAGSADAGAVRPGSRVRRIEVD
jgi:hypothetical protein